MPRTNPDALPVGTLLHWYRIDAVLGQGGFGLTYLATDTNLQQQVALKEYLPIECATRLPDGSVLARSEHMEERYRWGLERFVSEAQVLARFDHPNIIRVHSVFEHNHTAYMVMRYEQGENLESILRGGRALGETALLDLLLPILDGLEAIHAEGFIHRDIKPDNIYVRKDGTPVLIDFGSARQPAGASHMLTILVAPGYAPFEQYYETSSQQGPWTDIYSLGATLYRVVAGRPPVDAISRSRGVLGSTRDILVPAVEAGRGRYSQRFLEAIDRALCFNETDRPQSIGEWRRTFETHPGGDADGDPSTAPTVTPEPAQVPARRAPEDEPAPEAGPRAPASVPAPGRSAAAPILWVLLAVLAAGGGYLAGRPGGLVAVPAAAGPEDARAAAALADERRRLEEEAAALARRSAEVDQAQSTLQADRGALDERAAAVAGEEKRLSAREETLARAEAETAEKARGLEPRRAELDRREAEQKQEAERLAEARRAAADAADAREEADALGRQLAASRQQTQALRRELAGLREEVSAGRARVAAPESQLQARARPDPAAPPGTPPAARQTPAPAPLDGALAALRAGDHARARRLLTELSRSGLPEAEFHLGVMDLDGQGGPVRTAEGVSRLERAAAGGFVEAHRRLGELYAGGDGVIRDDFLAYTWLWAATRLGNEAARAAMEQVEGRLQPAEVEQARRQAEGRLVEPLLGRN